MMKQLRALLAVCLILMIAVNLGGAAEKQTSNKVTIKDTILTENLLMGVDLLAGSMGQPSIVLTLEKHPDARFVVSSAVGFKSGLIPPDGHYDGKNIHGWRIELTYDVNSKREIGDALHYGVVSLIVIDKTNSSPKSGYEKK